MSFAMEMPSFDAISNLAAAQKSLAASKQAYENWAERYEQNENELQQALARQAALKEEKELRERDIAEGTKHLQVVWMALGKPPAQPVSSPASPGPKRLTKEAKAAMSPEQKKAHKAAKKVAHDTRKALRTPEEQAMIDARVAKMQAALKASREAKKGILAAAGDDLPGLVAEGTA